MLVVGVVAVGLVALAVAVVLRRRLAPEPERGQDWTVPLVVDRRDFDRPDAPWLVAVFSSSTCLACRETWEKVTPLASDQVVVQELEAVADKAVHDRYGIDAVPLVLVADADGAVRQHFLGPPPTSELWAAVARLRDGDDADQPGGVTGDDDA